MHRCLSLLAQQLPTAATAALRAAPPALLFADRAVKVTCPSSPGCAFVCTPTLLACRCPSATAAVGLCAEAERGMPSAEVRLRGACAVSLFRGGRLAFYCAGDAARTQRHEIALKSGDVLALLGGDGVRRDWRDLTRTMRAVANEDLEYMAEEVLLQLATDAGGAAMNTCIMSHVHYRPSGALPQPPHSSQCATM